MCFAVIIGCGLDADPRSIRGALDAAARAIEDDDGRKLFKYIDQRAQHALGGIVVARAKARALIQRDYPTAERAHALAALGDGAQVDTAASLFARRCGSQCRKDLGDLLAAPLEETRAGEEIVVRTARGTRLNVFAGSHGWYGIVFHTQALGKERDRAARELRQIEQNAAVYRKRQALEAR